MRNSQDETCSSNWQKSVEDLGSKPDLLKEFCRRLVIQYRDKWPISEELLAKEFCEYFALPLFFGSINISEFSQKLNIELLEEEIAEDVFGVNFCFNGARMIVLCNRKERYQVQGHTFLHEIREILENEFQLLGTPALTEESKEDAADDFADAAFLFPVQNLFRNLMEKSLQLDKAWKQIVAILGLGVFEMFMIMASQYFSIYPQIEPPRDRPC